MLLIVGLATVALITCSRGADHHQYGAALKAEQTAERPPIVTKRVRWVKHWTIHGPGPNDLVVVQSQLPWLGRPLRWMDSAGTRL
jgi:hypothetical protein